MGVANGLAALLSSKQLDSRCRRVCRECFVHLAA
jgi:hypothetical protein